jgi:predicted O-methyltransferase YrrM
MVGSKCETRSAEPPRSRLLTRAPIAPRLRVMHRSSPATQRAIPDEADTETRMSDEEQWAGVDAYITETLVGQDASLDDALEASTAAGLPSIAVAPPQGKLLHLLARLRKARTILEIGTLGGYSTIWLARALPPDGRLLTLEADEKHAAVARANIARAGLDSVVEVRLGAALETLPRLTAERAGPFDLIFVDADKPNIPSYFEWALRLASPGALIIVDNVVRSGAIVDAASTDASVQGVRRLNEMIRRNARVMATTIQTVGAKGYDGFTIALVVDATERLPQRQRP